MVTTNPILISKRPSRVDLATKYIFDFHGLPLEYVYVDNRTGKDIVCVPSQYSCNLGCKFCHLTYRNEATNSRGQARQVDAEFTINTIEQIVKDLAPPAVSGNSTLLISFMGMGEPMLHPGYVLQVANAVRRTMADRYATVRFGLATIIPKVRQLQMLGDELTKYKLPLKVHWSLHHTDQAVRSELMPNADGIEASAEALARYRTLTGNPVEVHYTLFEGNDSLEHADALGKLAQQYHFPVKFLRFSERPDRALLTSGRRVAFVERVRSAGVMVEEYAPPGHDIQGACGEFEV